jgi:hypothetical protein
VPHLPYGTFVSILHQSILTSYVYSPITVQDFLPVSTDWATFHNILLAKLSTPIPRFRVAETAIPSKATRPPAKFDLHLPSDLRLRYVKWAPDLINEGMEKLKCLHSPDEPVRHPGDGFWARHNLDANVQSLRTVAINTGERQIQTIIDADLVRPICNIASRILFHLNADPLETPWVYTDLQMQTGDRGPPLWDTVIKFFPTDESKKIPILVDCILYAIELKSLTVAPSSFFYRLACRAAANLSSPKEFPFQRCIHGDGCGHAKKRNFSPSVDVPGLFSKPEELPGFKPTSDELALLTSDNRLLNDDHADNSGRINADALDPIAEFSKHPRAHVALAIIRSGAESLKDDADDDPVAKGLMASPRRLSDRRQPNATFDTAGLEEQFSPQLCQEWKWTGGDEFEEHYVCVLQQV